MLSYYIFLVLQSLILLQRCNIYCKATKTSPIGIKNLIIDISETIKADLVSGESVELSESTFQLLHKIVHSEFPVVFFESDLSQNSVNQIGRISEAFDQILGQVKNGQQIYPRILVSFKYTNESSNLADIKLVQHKYVVGMSFSSILQGSEDHRMPDLLKTFVEFNNVMWSSPKPSYTSHASESFLNFSKPVANKLVIGLSLEESWLRKSLAIPKFHEQGFFIVNIQLKLDTNFIGSYEHFEKIISEYSLALKNIFYQNQRTIPVFFRFQIQRPTNSNLYAEEMNVNSIGAQYAENYNKELQTFVQYWNEVQENAKILTIIEPVIVNGNAEDCNIGNDECNYIDTSELPLTVPYMRNIRFGPSIDYYDLCTVKDVLLEFYRAGFTTIALSSELVKALLDLKPNASLTLHCPLKNDYRAIQKKTISIYLIIEFDQNSGVVSSKNITNFLSFLSNQIDIEFVIKSIILPSSSFSAIQIVGSFGLQSFNCVGGSLQFTFTNNTVTLNNILAKLFEDTQNSCQNYFGFVKSIIWKVKFDFYELVHGKEELQFDQITSQITDKLIGLKTAKNLFKKNYPNHEITLMISGLYIYDEHRKYQTPINTLYCTEDAKMISMFYDTIFTWARIYEFPVIIKQEPVAYSPAFINPISWRRVDPYSEGDIINDELPVMIRRRYNRTFAVGHWVAGAYSCLDLPENVNKDGLKFDHGYSGATLNLNIKPKSGVLNISFEETEIWLLLTLQKFNFVEIFAGSQESLQLSLEVFQKVVNSFSFRKNLRANKISERSILFDVSMETLTDKTFFKHFVEDFSEIQGHTSKLEISTSVYLSNWNETHGDTELHSNIRRFRKTGVDIGLSVKKCGRALNIFFDMQRSTETKLEILPFDKVDYIICERSTDVSDIRGTSSNAAFLEGRLYVKKWMKLMFPNLKRIYFRLSSNLITKVAPGFEFQGDTQNILKFFTNVNNFAEEYKTYFFLAPAFRSADHLNTFSWWQISNFNELSNVSVYEEVQARFLNKETWKPKMYTEENVKDSKLPVWVWISWSVFGIACIILVLAIIVAMKIRRNSKLLSNGEIEEFLSGKQEIMTYGALGQNNDYVGAYNRSFEIQKEKIEIDTGKILGMGQFGVVYKAALSGYRKPVAVKTPNNACSKEMFIGMLSEVKLLCYVGKHENLVGFLGCCTKDIGKMVLYVVMELCECGSLHSHLLKMKTVLAYESRFADMIRFSKEIAAGMEYVSSKNIIHGDLATRNVLLDINKTCKIGDFGLSRKLYEYQTYVKKKQEPLPWKWMAYEALKSMEFSTQSDVWSFGVTIWEIFSLGDTPYPGLSWTVDFADELQNGLRMRKPGFASEEIYQIMLECWSIDPQDRPKFGDLLSVFRNLTPYENVIQ